MNTLCIPRVFSNISKQFIKNIINKYKLGFVDSIEIIHKKTDKGIHYKCVFIHLKWFNSENAIYAKQRFLDGKDIKIIYSEPFYWKMNSVNNNNFS